jgi:hypothetical protein
MRTKGQNAQRARESAAVRRGIAVPLGWHLVAHGATDMTPCRCTSHVYLGIPAVQILWRRHAARYWLRCTRCRGKWSRAALLPSSGGLCIDASHPEERAARRAERA